MFHKVIVLSDFLSAILQKSTYYAGIMADNFM